MKVLAFETSCDDSSVACMDAGGVRANLVSSQIDLHATFGGVVPELASRAHLTNLLPVTEAALKEAGWNLQDVEGIAATAGPGLVGAVLVGLSCAKSLAWSQKIPFVGVHHIEAHILANGIDREMALPALVLVVSGGHSETIYMERPGHYERLGSTRDDAAGETLDKGAKLMGLGYPGGPIIQKLAENGDPTRFDLPRPMSRSGELDFSFSGIKTAVRLALESLGENPSEQDHRDLAASLQAAVVDSLIGKTKTALAARPSVKGLYLAGGVAANGPLRQRIAALATAHGLDFEPPPFAYCTDNAAMVAHTGRLRLLAGEVDSLDRAAFARGGLPRWGF